MESCKTLCLKEHAGPGVDVTTSAARATRPDVSSDGSMLVISVRRVRLALGRVLYCVKNHIAS